MSGRRLEAAGTEQERRAQRAKRWGGAEGDARPVLGNVAQRHFVEGRQRERGREREEEEAVVT